MSYVIRETVTLLTASDGSMTTYTGFVPSGHVAAIRYVPDGSAPLDTGGDLAITGETTGVAILTAANIGTSAVTWYPRAGINNVADATALLHAAGGTAVPAQGGVPIAGERIKIIVAQGGNAKAGTLYFWID